MTQYNPPPQYGYGQQPPQPFPPGGMYPPPMPPAVEEPAGPKRYSMFAPWVMWFSPNVWRDVGRRWGGICFFYLLLLQLLTWLPIIAKAHSGTTRFLHGEGKTIIDQIPQVTITNGVVSIDKPEPYTVTDPRTGRPVMVFDTTGATTSPPLIPPTLLLTKSELIIRKQDGLIQTQDLSGIQSFQADSTSIKAFCVKVNSLIWPVGYPGLILLSIVLRYLQILLFASIGTAIASGMGAKLTFGGLMRLVALAITPIIFIDTITEFFGLGLGCVWWLIELGIEIAIFIFAIRANAAPKAAPPQYGFPMAPPTYLPPQG